jgi:hypothetical protein
MNSEPTAYVARFSWTARTVRMTLLSLAFLACAFVPNAPLWIAVVVGAFCLLGFLVFTVTASSRKVALRIDRHGVTLGGTPLPIGPKTDVVRWEDVVSIVLWTQHVGRQKMPYIGLQRRQGSPQLPGLPYGPRRKRINETLIPHVSSEIVQASRPINLWRLDRARLETAVAAFAPGVNIIDFSDR